MQFKTPAQFTLAQTGLAIAILLGVFGVYTYLSAIAQYEKQLANSKQAQAQTLDAKLQRMYDQEDNIRHSVCQIEASIQNWNAIASGSTTDRVQLKTVFNDGANARDVFLEEYRKFDCK